MIRQCDLRVERTAKRVLCAAERDEHRVARASEIVTAMARERVAQKRPVLVEHRAVALGAELRQQLRRALDVAEQERHGAGRSHRDGLSFFRAAENGEDAKVAADARANQARSACRNSNRPLLYCRAFGRPLRPGPYR